MTRKTVPLIDAVWLEEYASPSSRRRAILAEFAGHGRSDSALRSEAQVLAALVDVGRHVVDEAIERETYDSVYGSAHLDDEDAAMFRFYDEQAMAAFAADGSAGERSA